MPAEFRSWTITFRRLSLTAYFTLHTVYKRMTSAVMTRGPFTS